MARHPTPNAVLKKRGSRRVRKDEPEFSGGFGDPPKGMPERALDEWQVVAPLLEETGMGSPVERKALEAYCYAVEAFHQANDDLQKYGSVVETERGWVRNPACLNQNAAMGMILKFSQQFGLTPASRGKISGEPKKKENPFAEFRKSSG